MKGKKSPASGLGQFKPKPLWPRICLESAFLGLYGSHRVDGCRWMQKGERSVLDFSPLDRAERERVAEVRFSPAS